LLAITGLVLLIACANLANLMMARASVKRREVAIRMAMEASRGRILRQVLLESALLATFGAALGAAFAQPLSRALVNSLDTSGNTIHLTIMADWRVLLFAAVAASATCVIFGSMPALRSTRIEPLASLKSGERGVVGNRERFFVQRAMVITQIAVSMVLLVGALLFVRSYRNLMKLNPGIRESGNTLGYFGFESAHIKPENLAAYKRQLLEEVRAIPGIENAAATTIAAAVGERLIAERSVRAIQIRSFATARQYLVARIPRESDHPRAEFLRRSINAMTPRLRVFIEELHGCLGGKCDRDVIRAAAFHVHGVVSARVFADGGNPKRHTEETVGWNSYRRQVNAHLRRTEAPERSSFVDAEELSTLSSVRPSPFNAR